LGLQSLGITTDVCNVDLRSLEIRIERSENLPVLPQVVSEVLKLADDPEASPKQMERIIERDTAITAKILRVANSSYYGMNQVPSIGRAISMLGMNNVRSLVVGIAYQQLMSGRPSASKFNKVEYWRHSLGTAICARILAKLKLPIKSEELYVACMMLDIGLLVIDRFQPLELDKAISFAINEDMKLHEAELLMYGFDHSHVGAMLAKQWGLTDLIVDAVKYHHQPEMDENHQQYTALISLADQLAHACGLHNNVVWSNLEIDESVLEMVGIHTAQLEVVKTVVQQEILRAEEAFCIG
jgi:HD-like signal output (HDOD) protein